MAIPVNGGLDLDVEFASTGPQFAGVALLATGALLEGAALVQMAGDTVAIANAFSGKGQAPQSAHVISSNVLVAAGMGAIVAGTVLALIPARNHVRVNDADLPEAGPTVTPFGIGWCF